LPRGRGSGFIARVESAGETGLGLVPSGVFEQSGARMNRTRMQVFYSGRVQGVGFRYTTKSVAMGFEVTGTVRNLPDGRVDLTVEGAREELEAFRQAIRDSGMEGFIRHEQVNWSAATGEFRGFEIVR
jgi:acylphosphatase